MSEQGKNKLNLDKENEQNQSKDSLNKFKLKSDEDLKDEKEREQFFKERQDRIDRQEEIHHKITGGGLAVRDFGKALRIQANVKRFAKTFRTVFEKKHYETFQSLNGQIDECLFELNGKMKDTMSKKEYEMLHSFQTAIEKMAQELKQTQEKYKELEEIMINDKRVQALEKHLIFFRDQCSELKDLKTQGDKEINILKAQFEQEKTEREINRCALLRTEEECQGMRNLLEQKQSSINELRNQLTEYEEEKTNQQQQIEELNQIIIQQQQQIQQQEILEQNIYLTQIQQNNSQNSSNQSPFFNKNEQNTSNNNNPVTSKTRDIELSLLLRQINENMSSPQAQLQILKSYVNDQFSKKDEQLAMFQEQSDQFQQEKQQMMLENLANQDLTHENELRKLFTTGVEDCRKEIQKRQNDFQDQEDPTNNNNNNNSHEFADKFQKFDKIELFKKFICSQRFMEIVKTKIFNEKCCQNANCLYNIKSDSHFENKKNFDIYQTKVINPKIQDIIDQKLSSNNGSSENTFRVSKPSYLNTARPTRSNTEDQKTTQRRKLSYSNMTQKAQQFYDKQIHIQRQQIQQRGETTRQSNEQQIQQVKQRNLELYRHEKLYDKKLGERVDQMLKEFHNVAKGSNYKYSRQGSAGLQTLQQII